MEQAARVSEEEDMPLVDNILEDRDMQGTMLVAVDMDIGHFLVADQKTGQKRLGDSSP